jgi:two-component system, cell cycle sensor histidine kinase and response regulator CckA
MRKQSRGLDAPRRHLGQLVSLVVLGYLALGWARVEGQRLGYYGTSVGIGIMVVGGLLILALVHRRHSHLQDLVAAERDRFFNLAIDFLCVADLSGYFRRVNPAFTRVLGWSEPDLLAQPFLDLVHPDDRAATLREMETLRDGAETLAFQNRYRCKDGSWRWLDWNAVPVLEAGLIYATARDVTEIQKAREALRASEENLAVTLRSIGDAVLATDADGRVTRLNPVAEHLTGWAEAEAVGLPVDTVFRIVNEETREPAAVPVATVLRTGAVHGLGNHTLLIARDGTERPIGDSAAPIRDGTGRLIGVVLVFRDVTAERAAALALEEQNRLLEDRVRERTAELARASRFTQATLDALSDQVAVLGPDGSILAVNEPWRRFVARGSDCADSRRLPGGDGLAYLRELGDTGTGSELARRITEVIAGDRTQASLELALNGTGGARSYLARVTRFPGEGDVPVVLTLDDVTERRELESRLLQSQKMEAVGQLAGGIAHDFNNLLTVMTGYSDVLLAHAPDGSELGTAASQIHDAAWRAAGLTRQLLAFSRKQRLELRAVDLNEVVAQASTLLERLLGDNIELTTRSSPVPPVMVDPGQLEVVIMNLAVNARDAMPQGGRIVIETAPVTLDEAAIAQHPGAQPGRWVMLAVTDTGVGMDAETRARAFDPFFTTKDVGAGTGLGLDIVRRIVANHRGSVQVASQPGDTRFTVRLPLG